MDLKLLWWDGFQSLEKCKRRGARRSDPNVGHQNAAFQKKVAISTYTKQALIM